jgi:hypothetical protein
MAGHAQATGQEPLVLALSLCEYAHRHPITGQFSILGTIHWLELPQFPYRYPLLYVYGCLSDGRGSPSIVVRLVDIDESRPPVFERRFTVPFADPDIVVEFGLEAPNIVFPAPGKYRLQLNANNATILERRIRVEGPLPSAQE